MKEQLEAAVAAAAKLLATPGGAWIDGESSAEWYRRASRRRDTLLRCLDAFGAAECVMRNTQSDVATNVDAARAAVLENAARGDIQ